MRGQLKVLCAVAGLLPALACASHQVADPSRGVSSAQGRHYLGYPARYANEVQAQLFKGSLKGNVERIAAQNNWSLHWKVNEKLMVLVEARLAGPDFVAVMNELLGHYSVEATYQYNFKHGHKRMTVTVAEES